MKDRIYHEGEFKTVKYKILALVEKGQIIPAVLIEKYNSLAIKENTKRV